MNTYPLKTKISQVPLLSSLTTDEQIHAKAEARMLWVCENDHKLVNNKLIIWYSASDMDIQSV